MPAMPPAPIIAMLTLLFGEPPDWPMLNRGSTNAAPLRRAVDLRKWRRPGIFVRGLDMRG